MSRPCMRRAAFFLKKYHVIILEKIGLNINLANKQLTKYQFSQRTINMISF